MNAVHIPAADSETRQTVAPWGSLAWVASAALTGSSVTVGRMRLHPSQAGERHRHGNADEVIYLIRGAVRVEVGDDTAELQPGDALAIPPGSGHRITNPGIEEAEMVLAYSSGAREYTRE